MLKIEKDKHSKKKIYTLIASAFFILIAILFIIFTKNNYKTLNISSYRATLEITINSNKNSNKYILQQNHNSQEDVQEVLEPESIKGIKTTYNNGSLEIQSDKLNITKTYSDYKNLENNDLWLSSFIEEFKTTNEKSIEENNGKIMRIKNKKNHKALYLDEKTGKPTKLIIYDNNKKEEINIIYNEIEIDY